VRRANGANPAGNAAQGEQGDCIAAAARQEEEK